MAYSLERAGQFGSAIANCYAVQIISYARDRGRFPNLVSRAERRFWAARIEIFSAHLDRK